MPAALTLLPQASLQGVLTGLTSTISTLTSRCSVVPIHCHICFPKGRGAGHPQAFASAAWTALRCPPSHRSSLARGFKHLSAFSPHGGLRRRSLGHLYFAGKRSSPVAASMAVSTRPHGLGGERPAARLSLQSADAVTASLCLRRGGTETRTFSSFRNSPRGTRIAALNLVRRSLLPPMPGPPRGSRQLALVPPRGHLPGVRNSLCQFSRVDCCPCSFPRLNAPRHHEGMSEPKEGLRPFDAGPSHLQGKAGRCALHPRSLPSAYLDAPWPVALPRGQGPHPCGSQNPRADFAWALQTRDDSSQLLRCLLVPLLSPVRPGIHPQLQSSCVAGSSHGSCAPGGPSRARTCMSEACLRASNCPPS